MKTIVHKLIALSLVLLFCLAPMAAQAQSLLSDRLAKAFDAGRTIEIAVGLDLDDSLGMFGLLPPESFAAMQELLRATTLRVSATQDSAGQMEIGFELRMQEVSVVDGRAWLTGDQLAVTTNLLPGKTLLIEAAELFEGFFKGFQGSMEQITAQMENPQALGVDVERYATLIADWVGSTERQVAVNEEVDPGTPWRDASAQSLTLRVTPGELKELLTTLAEELVRDEALAQTISLDASLPEAIQALAPTDNVMEWTVYLDERGEVTGAVGNLPTMFGEGAAEGRFAYDRLSAGGPALLPSTDTSLERHRVGVELVEEGVGVTSFSVEAAKDPQAPRGSVHAYFRQSDKESATTLALKHAYSGTVAADRETLESSTGIDVQIQSNTADSDDSMDALLSSMGDTTFSAALHFSSDTRAIGPDDFLCESALGIDIMGMALGRVLVTLTSGAHVPADAVGNEAIDLAGLDAAGLAALYEELNAGLEQAMARAMAQLPPELLQLILMMQ